MGVESFEHVAVEFLGMAAEVVAAGGLGEEIVEFGQLIRAALLHGYTVFLRDFDVVSAFWLHLGKNSVFGLREIDYQCAFRLVLRVCGAGFWDFLEMRVVLRKWRIEPEKNGFFLYNKKKSKTKNK